LEREDWDRRYDGVELVWRAAPNQFLVSETADLEPGRALDLACGEGRNAIWLAEHGWQATGVDFSPVGLEKARRFADERQVAVEWIEADARRWHPTSSYDLVVVFYLQLPGSERRDAYRAAAGAVAPGGTLLVVGHDRSNLEHGFGGPQDPDLLFSAEDVLDDLGDLRDGYVVQRAEPVRRAVTVDGVESIAIDALVRAVRTSSES
jgi:SAM-dependent methyltransferase